MAMFLRRAFAPRRAAAVLVAACGGAFLAPWSAATGELPGAAAVDAPPHLVITFESALPHAGGSQGGELPSGAKGALEDVEAVLRLGDASAVAALDLGSWPLVSATGEKAQIDVRLKGKHRLFGMRRF
jgi:hypothetical protein